MLWCHGAPQCFVISALQRVTGIRQFQFIFATPSSLQYRSCCMVVWDYSFLYRRHFNSGQFNLSAKRYEGGAFCMLWHVCDVFDVGLCLYVDAAGR